MREKSSYFSGKKGYPQRDTENDEQPPKQQLPFQQTSNYELS